MVGIDIILEYWELGLTTIVLPLIAWFIKKNQKFTVLIKEFKDKLPPKYKRASRFTKMDAPESEVISPLGNQLTLITVKTHDVSIDENTIDEFYNKLESINFNFVIFAKHYKSIIYNLGRFKPTSKSGNFDIVMVQELLDKVKIDFFDILWYKLAIKSRILTLNYKLKMFMFTMTKNYTWLK